MDDRGNLDEQETYYPPAVFRREPPWIHDLTKAASYDIFELLKEVYTAIHNDSRRLAVMGIRALLEQLMIDKVGDQHSFKGNLDAFESAGWLSRSQRTVVEHTLEAGHAAIHRSFKPTAAEVVALMDVTEHVVEAAYIIDLRTEGLDARIPSRARSGKRAPAD